MIKVNFLGSGSHFDPKRLIWLASYIVSVFLVFFGTLGYSASLSMKVSKLEGEQDNLKAEVDALKIKTERVSKLEETKNLLAKKLSAVAILKKNKVGPVRVLDDMNSALPEEAWLVDLNEKSNSFQFVGRAIDDVTISKFMRAIEESKYFKDVALAEVTQETVSGAKVKSFKLSAPVSYSGIFEEKKDSLPSNSKAAGKRR